MVDNNILFLNQIIKLAFITRTFFSSAAKAAEAAASGTAYYDPQTHYAYVPPAYVSVVLQIITLFFVF